ncbi:hypothetical protein CYMTET_23320 [Cymbomonas tetramitiformis]|uniref:Cytochrome P450 n=1 Tax=Cymbomonas tetramitiformis TaxID=36881 RepID=A0AAE0L1B7_9CHLO|nr:hypothetical protein CYMTET_23320 [Cymbomonas tetramitiformis]
MADFFQNKYGKTSCEIWIPGHGDVVITSDADKARKTFESPKYHNRMGSAAGLRELAIEAPRCLNVVPAISIEAFRHTADEFGILELKTSATVDIQKFMRCCTFRVICKLCFGMPVEHFPLKDTKRMRLYKAVDRGQLNEAEMHQCMLEMLIAGTDTSSVIMSSLVVAMQDTENLEETLYHEAKGKCGELDAMPFLCSFQPTKQT